MGFQRILTHYEQALNLSPERRAAFDAADVKDKDHRGKRWPYSFTAQLESVGLENIMPVVRDGIEKLIDHGQLSRDRKRSEEERKDILSRVGPLIEEGEDAQDDKEEGKVPPFVIEHLENQTLHEIDKGLSNLSVKLTPAHRVSLTKEISQRLARRLRQGA